MTGVLQGAGQSVVDLFGQIWNLVTKPGETITGIINSIKALFGDSKLLLKLLQDSMLELIKTDTMGRANLIGKAVGQFVPDVVLAFLTAGVRTVAKNSLTALKTSTKLAGTIVKFEKFVGRTIKILNGKYQFLLKKVGSGIGANMRDLLKIIPKMTDIDFDNFLLKVKKLSDKEYLQGLRKAFQQCGIAVASNNFLDFFTIKTYATNLCNFPHGYKHYPPKNSNWLDVIKSTVSGPAKYKPDIIIPDLEKIAL